MGIIDLPNCFATVDRTFEILDTLSETRGVYSFEEHRLDFMGEIWRCTVSLHNLNHADAGEVYANLDRFRESHNSVRMGFDIFTDTLAGSTTTAETLTVTADTPPGTRSVPVAGIGAASSLRWGCFVQIGDHWYRNRANIAGDAGNMALRPRLRKQLFAGDTVTLKNPQSVWRLVSRPPELRRGRYLMGAQVQFMEALRP